MKIKELYVAGFGKLKDLKMTFDDGLNVIVRDNGFGKTTLCAFIKAMFYGMPVTRSKTADDPRKSTSLGAESITEALSSTKTKENPSA